MEATAAQRWKPVLPVSPVTAVIVATTAVALLLRLYVMIRPGVLSVTQYDDGPYFGSAVRLAHGIMPYRDYALVQPPGITLLLAPVGLLTYLTGTASGLVVARVLTVLASTGGVLLAGLLVRHRGPWAALIAGGFLAVYPTSTSAAHTVLLEPWLVLFCMVGAVSVFDGDRLSTATGRLAWGGAAFGFAGAVKTWAIAPVLVLLVLFLPDIRRAVVFAAGVAAGFVIPVLPFAAVAPRQFYDSVITAQLTRAGNRTPAWIRLRDMISFIHDAGWAPAVTVTVAAVITALIVAAYVAAWLVQRQAPPVVDVFALATAATVVAMFMLPPYFAAHYTAFLGPFLALVIALPLTRLAAAIVATRRAAATTPASVARRGRYAGLAVAVIALLVAALLEAPAGLGGPEPTAGAAERVIPAGACVVTDQASYTLLANRFTSNAPGCSQMVDGLGTDLALSAGLGPSDGADRYPAVIAAWRQAFQHAQYVLLSKNYKDRIPGLLSPNARLRAPGGLWLYFKPDFTLVLHHGDYRVYARLGASR